NALRPGWVATGLAGNNGWRGWLWRLAARCFAISPEKGARTVVHLAAAPETAGVNGSYFVKERPAAPAPAALDRAAARRLWQVSLALTGLAEEVLPPSTSSAAP